jgi:mycothiol synthase
MGIIKVMKRISVACGAKKVVGAFSTQQPPIPLLRMHRKLPRGEQLPTRDVPAPYQLRCYSQGEESRWVELLNTSREFGQWGPERLNREILSTLIPQGGIFAVHKGELIGCASACFIPKYAPDAHLMYVALLPEHRGAGLGQALVLESLRVCQCENLPGMSLVTESHRLAAVRSYFKLGFAPLLGDTYAGRAQWSAVLSKAFLAGVG